MFNSLCVIRSLFVCSFTLCVFFFHRTQLMERIEKLDEYIRFGEPLTVLLSGSN